MIDFMDTFEKFAALKKALIGAELDLTNGHDRPLAGSNQHQLMRTLQMAETEAQALLVLLLRIRGNKVDVRKFGQDAPVGFSAGFDSATKQVTFTSTDMLSGQTNSFLMPTEQFDRLIDYLVGVRDQAVTAAKAAAAAGNQ